jgi:hypothetical protein
MENIFRKEFIEQTLKSIDENTSKIKACMNQLDEKDIWFRPNEHVNSVGNIILHLCGNIRQWIISSLSGAPDIRERDLEFSTMGGFTKEELTTRWRHTMGSLLLLLLMPVRKICALPGGSGFSAFRYRDHYTCNGTLLLSYRSDHFPDQTF